MQFAIIASFAALALAAPWKPETTTSCATSTAPATSSASAVVSATTAAAAPGVTPISGNGSNGSGSGNSGSDNSGSGSGSGNESDLCPALYTPQCCQADVLGLVGLTCDAPSLGLTSQQSFVDDCANTGSRAQCCILPVAGQAVICTDV
ncbi:hypothetical protein M409DRAFT_22795 [Zasmidium cellare ATCC 36951]|uniref:Hydrophobin n=1 Tax=Zasmidium cellare ATCC 36951 TaxID=1080233 RepID=A0A6A6CI91_ZASCE|nr:uncharacterized protein M409DRAFT_22795 [Zasmidium cellare ATCC 36951]KAF2166741.1 hypothetical protein M409DRAFT_22795 [Zasmidium cellare ATCC 36951]